MVVDKCLAERREQFQSMLEIRTLNRRIVHQQIEQMTNGLIGSLQIVAHVLLYACKKLLTAR